MTPDGVQARVLMLNYEFPPIGGGSGNATYHLLTELSRFPSLQIDLITSKLGAGVERTRFSPSIELFKLPVGKRSPHFWTAPEIARWTWKAYATARRLTRERQYDVCHCWSGWPSGIIG